MEPLIIPPPPNWYQTDIMACAPDNTLIYGSSRDLVVIKPNKHGDTFANQLQGDNVNVISPAHAQKIISVNINRQWDAPHKYAVTTSEIDNIVKVWDIEHLEQKFSHNKHCKEDVIVGAAFAGDDRVISVIESGRVIVWNIVKDETTTLNSLFAKMVGKQSSITCFSVCPHASWRLAVGMKNGLIVVLDIRKSGSSLYTLRGHGSKVLSLSWCPAPINIFPKVPNNKVVERSDDGNAKLALNVARNKGEVAQINNKGACETLDEVIVIPEEGGFVEHDTANVINPLTKDPLDLNKYQQTPPEGENIFNDPVPLNNDKLTKKAPQKNSEVSHVVEAKIDKGENVCQIWTAAQIIQELETKPDLCHSKENPLGSNEEHTVDRCDTELISFDGTAGMSITANTLTNNTVKITKDCSLEKVQVADSIKSNDDYIDTPTDNNSKGNINDTLNKTEVPASVEAKVENISPCGAAAPTIEQACQNVQPAAINFFQHLGAKSLDLNEGLQTPMESKLLSYNNPVGLSNITSSPVYFESKASFCKDKFNSNMSPLSDIERDPDTPTDRRVLSMELTLCDETPAHIVTSETTKKSEPATALNDRVNDQGVISNDSKAESGSGISNVLSSANVVNWRTVGNNVVGAEEMPRKEFLLASSAQEDNIYIWRAGTDGRMQTLLNSAIPIKSKTSKNTTSSWNIVCWISPNVLLSSTKNADLIRWTLPKPLDKPKYFKKVHSFHYKAVMAIKGPIRYCTESNFLEPYPLTAWTIGLEGLILNFDFDTLKYKVVHPTAGGSVNCCAGSPMDPYRIAFGTGQREIQIWNISKLKKTYSPDVYYKDIYGAVTALSWHGHKESWLAWGTVEGRIGLIDLNKGKGSKVLPHYFKSQIHKLEWGPFSSSSSEQKLFVISEGKLAIFDAESTDGPHILRIPDESSIYSMSWKPDFSYLLAVSRIGKMYKYSPVDSLSLDEVFYIPLKLESIIWHPSAEQSLDMDGYSEMFASVEKFCNVCILNLAIKSNDFEEKVVAKFTNHQDTKINDIKWNPYVLHHLIILDDSGVAQIFDIKSKAVIHTFINKWLDPLLCLYWTPWSSENSFQLIMGTKNRKMLFFPNFDYPPLTSEEIENKVKQMRRALAKKGSKIDSKEATKNKTQKKSAVVPYFYTIEEQEQFADMKKLLLWKLGVNKETANNKNNDLDILDVFGNDEHLEHVFEINYVKLYKDRKYSQINMLSLFEGDISTVFKQAIEQKRVNAWIISMAPLVSSTLWKSAYEVYAAQLMDEHDSDPMQIVSLLLACHKVEESVRFLCEKQLFREAFLLAKTRFGANSALVSDTLVKWANHCFAQGNYEFAACCFISSGNYEDAAEVLIRRNNASMLEMSAHLAKLSQNKDLLSAIAVKLCRLPDSYNELHESCGLDPDLETAVNKYLTLNSRNHNDYLQSSGNNLSRLGNTGSYVDDQNGILHIEPEKVVDSVQLNFPHEHKENDLQQPVPFTRASHCQNSSIVEDDTPTNFSKQLWKDIILINNMKLDESLTHALPREMPCLAESFNCPLYIGCEKSYKELNSDLLQLASVCHGDTCATKPCKMPEDNANEQSLVELEHDIPKSDVNRV